MLGKGGLPGGICEKEGSYIEENSRLIPELKGMEVPIECNGKYCRTRDISSKSVVCWKCTINNNEFVEIFANSLKELDCGKADPEYEDFDALDAEDEIL